MTSLFKEEKRVCERARREKNHASWERGKRKPKRAHTKQGRKVVQYISRKGEGKGRDPSPSSGGKASVPFTRKHLKMHKRKRGKKGKERSL